MFFFCISLYPNLKTKQCYCRSKAEEMKGKRTGASPSGELFKSQGSSGTGETEMEVMTMFVL